MQPLTVRGERFHAGGRPHLVATNFLTAGEPRSLLTHTYLSEATGPRARRRMRETLRADGYNAIFVYTLNEGDYGSRTTPYRDRLIGGALDEARLARWRGLLEELVAEGLRPVLWLFADDSPTVHAADEEALVAYLDAMVERFGDLPVLWVLALEVDEYWPRARVDRLGRHLAARTPHPVGVHQVPGATDYMAAAWVDFAVYQYRRGPDGDAPWAWFYQETLGQREALPGKPFLAAEYDNLHGGHLAQERGLAAVFAGAAGVGNGAPPGLAEFFALLPEAARPAREGEELLLRAAGVRAVAEPGALRFSCSGCGAFSPQEAR